MQHVVQCDFINIDVWRHPSTQNQYGPPPEYTYLSICLRWPPLITMGLQDWQYWKWHSAVVYAMYPMKFKQTLRFISVELLALNILFKSLYLNYFRVAAMALGQLYDCPGDTGLTARDVHKFATESIHNNGEYSTVYHFITTILHCLLNCWSRRSPKEISKLLVTGLCAENSPVSGEFPAQKASNAENDSIWWLHHVVYSFEQ